MSNEESFLFETTSLPSNSLQDSNLKLRTTKIFDELDRSYALTLQYEELKNFKENKSNFFEYFDYLNERYDSSLLPPSLVSSSHKPYFLIFVSLVQIFLFSVSLIYNKGFASLSENIMIGPSAQTLVQFGANLQFFTKIKFQWFRLLSSVFLHTGLLHLFSNLLIQYQIGFRLEKLWGHWKIILIYLISGIGGNIWSAVFMSHAITVGSSGSLIGICASILVDTLVHWKFIKNPKRQFIFWITILLLFYTLGFISSNSNIDNWVHTFGLIHGIFVAFLLIPSLHVQTSIWNQTKIQILFHTAFLLLLLLDFYILYF